MTKEEQEYNDFIAEVTQKVSDINNKFKKLPYYNKQRAIQYFIGSSVSLAVIERFIAQMNLGFYQGR